MLILANAPQGNPTPLHKGGFVETQSDNQCLEFTSQLSRYNEDFVNKKNRARDLFKMTPCSDTPDQKLDCVLALCPRNKILKHWH